MAKLGFNFTDDQLEELFAYLDKDRDNKLFFDELEESFFNQAVNIPELLRNIRRAIVRSEVNLLKKFQ